MGLWQNLVAGYDENHEQLSNVAQGGLYPLSSTTISNNKTTEYFASQSELLHFVHILHP